MDIDIEKIGDSTIATTKSVTPTTPNGVGSGTIHTVSTTGANEKNGTNQGQPHGVSPHSTPQEEEPWTLASESDSDSQGGEQDELPSVTFAAVERGQRHSPVRASFSPDGVKTEEPWTLAPESETGGTRPPSLLEVNPGGAKSFNAFAVSHHRDNLVEIVEETEPLLSRLGLRSRSRPKGGSSPAESDDWARPTPQDPSGLQKSYRISFAELQRMHLRKLQCKLVKHVVDIRFRNKEPDGWEADLQSYTKALQDYDYMFTHSQRLRDDFLVTGERFIDDYVLHTMLDAEAGKDAKLTNSAPITVAGPWEDKRLPIGGTRSENRAKSELAQLRDRTVMALLGGLFLVGPMWLMMLRKTLYTCLVATTVCVTIFGLVMARLLDKPMEVLSGTAAYAAVLVVFVGLNNADGAEGNRGG